MLSCIYAYILIHHEIILCPTQQVTSAAYGINSAEWIEYARHGVYKRID